MLPEGIDDRDQATGLDPAADRPGKIDIRVGSGPRVSEHVASEHRTKGRSLERRSSKPRRGPKREIDIALGGAPSASDARHRRRSSSQSSRKRARRRRLIRWIAFGLIMTGFAVAAALYIVQRIPETCLPPYCAPKN
jgi:hypothetical protein